MGKNQSGGSWGNSRL